MRTRCKKKRLLGAFELAQILTNEYSPFNAVIVIKIVGRLEADAIRSALLQLQRRHPILEAHITEENDRRYFVRDEKTPVIPLEVCERRSDEHWTEIAEEELNRRLDITVGPLMRCRHLKGADKSEIVLTFLHAVVDGPSAPHIARELLILCSGGRLPPVEDSGGLMPPADEYYPPRFKGIKKYYRLTRFLMRQMREEVTFRWQSRSLQARPSEARGHIHVLPVEYDEARTLALTRHSRVERVSLNSVLSAALMLAVQQKRYYGRGIRMRAFTFANLRPYLRPRIPDHILGSYSNMQRFSFHLGSDPDLWSLVRDVHRTVYASAKRGDKFAFHATSPAVMRLILNQSSMRMGHTALSFGEAINLNTTYGDLSPTGFHAFTSNFNIGPEFSCMARLFRNRLCFDYLYLSEDMDQGKAEEIAETVTHLLTKTIGGKHS